MSVLSDLEIFAQVVRSGSLSAAARELDSSTGMISKRLSRLEQRLGARLLHRTTRQLTVTDVGEIFYARVLGILDSVQDAEDLVLGRSGVVHGVLKISAPTSFGRMHLVPHLKTLLDLHPGLEIDLSLSDDLVDLIAEGFDVAIRIAELEDSRLIAQRLATNQRVLCAAPDYLAQHGQPRTLEDLEGHRLLATNRQLPWKLQGPDGPVVVRGSSHIRTNSNEVVREAAISGLGIALRSLWEIQDELRRHALEVALPDYSGSADAAIYAVYPTRRLVPPKVRALVDFLMRLYGGTPPWEVAAVASAGRFRLAPGQEALGVGAVDHPSRRRVEVEPV